MVKFFFSLAYDVKVHLQYFFSILCSSNYGIIYTRFHASVCSLSLIFYVFEKTSMLKNFFYFFYYVDRGGDYTSQYRSEFESYNPHLYNYLCVIMFASPKKNEVVSSKNPWKIMLFAIFRNTY